MEKIRNFALIKNGIVDNVIVAARSFIVQYLQQNPDFSDAIDVTQYPVGPGDLFENGIFKRNGVEIKRIPTDKELVVSLGQENTDLLIENLSLGQYATDLELRLIALEERV